MHDGLRIEIENRNLHFYVQLGKFHVMREIVGFDQKLRTATKWTLMVVLMMMFCQQPVFPKLKKYSLKSN